MKLNENKLKLFFNLLIIKKIKRNLNKKYLPALKLLKKQLKFIYM